MGDKKSPSQSDMPRSNIPILCTRAIDPYLIQTSERAGFTLDIVPFIRIEAVNTEELKKQIELLSTQVITVAFTSMNAVENVTNLLGGRRPNWKIFCTAHATRRSVVNYFGPDAVGGVAENASGLADSINASSRDHRVVFFCGDQHREELPRKLRDHGTEISEVIVYQTILLPRRVTRNYKGVLFFSPTAVVSYFSADNTVKNQILFAIGDTTATSIRSYCNNKIVTPAVPDQKHLIQKLVDCYPELCELP